MIECVLYLYSLLFLAGLIKKEWIFVLLQKNLGT